MNGPSAEEGKAVKLLTGLGAPGGTYKAGVRPRGRSGSRTRATAGSELRSERLSGGFAEKAPLRQLFDANSPTNGSERMIDTSKPEGK